MAEIITASLDATRLLFDLQRANEIIRSFSGCLDPALIAQRATNGLVERFGCAFARIWLVEPEGTMLRLVASSGLYTRTNGSFAQVPMGAYKVGKIAQNRVSFLSNNLAEESWVKDREWAIANRIRGFAGFPLTVSNSRSGTAQERVIGVLATFSHSPLAPEFLEVLQVLCTMASVSLETALHYRQQPSPDNASDIKTWKHLALSDQLATILGSVRLTLIGTEQPLTLAQIAVFLQVTEVLARLDCRYCRLIYQEDFVALEAIATVTDAEASQEDWTRSQFGLVCFTAVCLGGSLQSQAIAHQQVVQVALRLPYPPATPGACLQIQCRLPLLQLAFTHLAYAAGLQICDRQHSQVPLLIDDLAQIQAGRPILWVQQGNTPVPQGVSASINLSTTPEQLREALAVLEQGETWGIVAASPLLSEREREILGLLATGLRDRDIANRLIISESTVKFHVNNVLSKLKSRTRFQALNQAIKQGWL